MESQPQHHNMLHRSGILLRMLLIPLAVLLSSVMTACSSDDDGDELPKMAEKTLFVYMPWSGNGNALTGYFYGNISSLKKAIVNRGGLDNERVVVFFSTSNAAARMYEIVFRDGACDEVLLKEYLEPPLTTAAWITSVMRDMQTFAPADTYAMVIGGHGYGWLKAEDMAARGARRVPYLYGMDEDSAPLTRFLDDSMTRFFGGTQTQYRTDITTLAQGIADAGVHMQYILFDVCYMSSVEAIYDLRTVAGHIVACPTEIMSEGMPYDRIGNMLLGVPDYNAICTSFHEFYKSSHATIGVTVCSELDALAEIMREINRTSNLDESRRASIQCMDGNSPALFYDLGDYVDKLCTDSVLLRRFRRQLSLTVPFKAHTDSYPYVSGGYLHTRKIDAYSGITTSASSRNKLAAGVEDTNWHIATH